MILSCVRMSSKTCIASLTAVFTVREEEYQHLVDNLK